MTSRTFVYTGAASAPVPEGSVELSDRDARGDVLVDALSDARLLVVLDAVSYPVDAFPIGDVPVVVRLPDLEADELDAVVGDALVAELGPFDAVMTDDDARWTHAAERYGLAESQRIPDDVAAAVSWSAPDAVPPGSGLRWADGDRDDGRSLKGRFRAMAHPVGIRLADASVSSAAAASVAVVAAGTRPWIQVAGRRGGRVAAYELREDDVAAAALAHPAVEVSALGDGSALSDLVEAYDATLVAIPFGELSVDHRLRVLAAAHRSVRPGGSLLLVGDFVDDGHYPEVVGLSELLAEVMEATLGRVVLHDVEAIRFDSEVYHTSAVVSLTRLGAPEIL